MAELRKTPECRVAARQKRHSRFRLVAGSQVRIDDEKQAAEAQAKPATAVAASETRRPPFNPLRTVNVVCLILNDLNPETRSFAFESARKFVNEELRPNTFIGVFSLDGGGLRPIFPFSNNREHLVKAVELAAVNQLPGVDRGSAALLSGLAMSATGSVFPAPARPATRMDRVRRIRWARAATWDFR